MNWFSEKGSIVTVPSPTRGNRVRALASQAVNAAAKLRINAISKPNQMGIPLQSAWLVKRKSHTGVFSNYFSIILVSRHAIYIYIYISPGVAKTCDFHMVITYSGVWIKPDIVANPARGQLYRERLILPRPRSRLRIRFCEADSAVSSRVSLLALPTQAESGF